MSELVIGIIGHRDLCPNDETNIQALESCAQGRFFRKEYKTQSVPLFTSLASEADQFATRILKEHWSVAPLERAAHELVQQRSAALRKQLERTALSPSFTA